MPSVAQFAEQRLAKAERDLEGGSSFAPSRLRVFATPECGGGGGGERDSAATIAFGATSFVYVLSEADDACCRDDVGGGEGAGAAANVEEGQGGGPAAPLLAALKRDGRAYVYTHDHPHFLLRVIAVPPLQPLRPLQADADAEVWTVPRGAIALSTMQAINNHCCVGEPYEWHLFQGWRDEPGLSDVTLELRHRFNAKVASTVELDLKAVQLAASTLLLGLLITVNETFLLRVPVKGNDHVLGEPTFVELVARVIEVSPEQDDEVEEGEVEGEVEDEDEVEDDEKADGKATANEKEGSAAKGLTVADNYRGLVEATTTLFLRVDEAVSGRNLSLSTASSGGGPLPVKPPGPPPRNVVGVTTADGEYFPVKAKLLRPCLALTSAVQAGRGVHLTCMPTASVAVECCDFDRVLLFLEATATGRAFDILPEHLEGMSNAGDVLKLQSLRDLCARKRGAFESRVRKEPISFEEVVRRNGRGKRVGGGDGESGGEDSDDGAGEDKSGDTETLLLLDGMVLDVSRWLPEHPGGSGIIPTQALNLDCTVFFEIYHVSRQSFLYLKEFYIGELREADRAKVPRGAEGASPGFLVQLRQHTSWRVSSSTSAPHKSF